MKPQYLETDASEVGLRAWLLQTRDGINCCRNKAPDSNILRPIHFAAKRISAAEKRYSNV